MLYLGVLVSSGGIEMYLENKGGTYLIYYKSKLYDSYMYLALDGTILASTFRNALYNEILKQEFLVRRDWVLSKIDSL